MPRCSIGDLPPGLHPPGGPALPVYPELTDEQITYVVNTIREYVAGK
jgi:hypothetical protein